ncbi:hypothetical protein KP509_34G011700 [Ceratopteris richardii]|uniref:CID domain-containing protein n=1 Tax=Ceratopteris richardii TaxID=49495 RepID=A0A8T2QJX0_CERRI|nr:hypothetical protein KP509_34G011700 [Ceratopteris richardii]KAH7283532.1 hypothetical protein KP509_34G011700 [Ceratopteris richardii]
MNSAFNSQILAEKLKKLNNSQQSIETLSHWCIFHRKKARLVVETWDKQFRELSKEQQVPFLYLANDILQNSRRRGGEFVTEFWKILPGALKDVLQKGDDRVHNVVFRLVDIWDDRKVFGSRSRTLREELLGNDPPADLAEHRVKSNHTIKIKIPIGGIQEKLTSAYRAVHDVASDEDATLGRCNAAVIRIEGLEKEASTSRNLWESHDMSVVDELQEQENILTQCAEQLEMSELARAALVSHLKEALREQESKLELIRTQLQTARTQAEHSAALRQQFLQAGNATAGEIVEHEPQETREDVLGASTIPQSARSTGDTSSWSVASTEGVAHVAEEVKDPRSAAAEVAAKLAASASSAQMLQSVLSSFVAEEASNSRAESAPLEAAGTSIPDKRQKLSGQNDSTPSSDGSPSYLKHSVPLVSLPSVGFPQHSESDHASTSQMTSSSSTQLHYPPTCPINMSQPQYLGHSAGIHVPGYGYASNAPPPPPLPPIQQQHLVMGVPPPMSINSHNGNTGGFQSIQPPGVRYYGQIPMPNPHVPRH